jgi:hypothetical protein
MSKAYEYASGWIIMIAFSMIAFSSTASAASVKWYSDHIELAKGTQATCNARLQKRETLPEDVLEECRRANEAMLHAHRFTPSKPMNW